MFSRKYAAKAIKPIGGNTVKIPESGRINNIFIWLSALLAGYLKLWNQSNNYQLQYQALHSITKKPRLSGANP